MRKLSKRDVEALLNEYDDNPVVAVHTALHVLIPDCPTEWNAAVELLPFDAARKQLLRACDTATLDALVKQFVETRCL